MNGPRFQAKKTGRKDFPLIVCCNDIFREYVEDVIYSSEDIFIQAFNFTKGSSKQIGFYRYIISCISECQNWGGWTKQEIHEYLLFKYYVQEELIGDKKIITPSTVISVESIGKKNLTKFIDRVLNGIALEHGIVVEGFKNKF